MDLAGYNFVAWVGVPAPLHLDDLERALRTFLPGIFLASADQDEVEIWRSDRHGVMVEVQRAAFPDPEDREDGDLNFVCMVSAQGREPLENASNLVAERLSDAAGIKCRPLATS